MKGFWSAVFGCLTFSFAFCSCSHGASQQSATSAESAAPSATQAATAPLTTPFATLTPASTQVSFTDINGDYGQQAITDLAALGILDSKSGAFSPDDPVTRALFVRWLVKADNVYFKDDPGHQIRLAHGTTSTFLDVRPDNPDYPYIQGLANAGFVIGVDAAHFAPDQPLTREQMIGIKAAVDEGRNVPQTDPGFLANWLPGQFTDAASISPRFASAIHEDFSVRTTNNIARVWGSIKTFRPANPVTRSEAAIAISEIGTGSAAVALGRTPPPTP